MTISIVVQLIIAILKAFPVVRDAVFNEQIKDMKRENRDALRKAIEQQDQRDLEIAMGSTKPGKPSGIPGTEIVSDLPGLD